MSRFDKLDFQQCLGPDSRSVRLLGNCVGRRLRLGIDRAQLTSNERRVFRRDLGGAEDGVGVLAHRLGLATARGPDLAGVEVPVFPEGEPI